VEATGGTLYLKGCVNMASGGKGGVGVVISCDGGSLGFAMVPALSDGNRRTRWGR